MKQSIYDSSIIGDCFVAALPAMTSPANAAGNDILHPPDCFVAVLLAMTGEVRSAVGDGRDKNSAEVEKEGEPDFRAPPCF